MSATTFISGIIIARSLPIHEFGVYVLGLSIVVLLIVVQDALLANSYQIFAPRMGDLLPEYVGSILAHHAGFLVATTVALIAMTSWARLHPTIVGLDDVTLALVVALPPILSKSLIRQLCLADLRYDLAIAVNGALNLTRGWSGSATWF